jgi:hypothetical protein
MKKLIVTAALALLLPLSACSTTNQEYEEVANKIVGYVVQGCNFAPSPETVQALISAWDINSAAMAGMAYEQIKDAVCGAVQSRGSAPGATPTVKGPNGETVEIKGEFLPADMEGQ